MAFDLVAYKKNIQEMEHHFYLSMFYLPLMF